MCCTERGKGRSKIRKRATEGPESTWALRSCSAFEPFFKRSAHMLSGPSVARFLIFDVPPPANALPEHTLANVAQSAVPTVARYLGWMALPLDQSAYVQNPYVTSPRDPRLLGALVLEVTAESCLAPVQDCEEIMN